MNLASNAKVPAPQARPIAPAPAASVPPQFPGNLSAPTTPAVSTSGPTPSMPGTAASIPGSPPAAPGPGQGLTPGELMHSFDKGLQAGTPLPGAGAVPPPQVAPTDPQLAQATTPSAGRVSRRRAGIRFASPVTHASAPDATPAPRWWQDQRPQQGRPQPRRRRCPLTPPTYGPTIPAATCLLRHRARRPRRRRVLHRFTPRRGKAAQHSPRSCVKHPRRRHHRRRRAWEPKPSRPPPPALSPERHLPTPPRGRVCSDWWPPLPASSPGWPGRPEIAPTTRRC